MLALAVVPAAPAADFGLCGPFGPAQPAYSPLPPGSGTRLEADRLTGNPDTGLSLTGDVVYRNGPAWARSPFVDYRLDPRRLELTGGVSARHRDLALEADSAVIRPDADTAAFRAAHYWLFPAHGYGYADLARQLDPERYRLDGATFSTCPRDDQDWQLRAARVEIDQASGVGRARHARLALRGVPVLYSPWLSFPIDDRRKSGFLTPSFGSSTQRGNELATPYYLNLAPHMDATITPRYMSDRGVMLGGEFRYLHPRGRARAALDYLPEDRATDSARHLLEVEHRGRWSAHWGSRLELRRASDERYMEDFGADLVGISTNHLESVLDVVHRRGGWTSRLRLQDFQTVDPDIATFDEPYSRLPQLRVTGHQRLAGGLRLDLAGEWSHFDHPAADRPTGHRLDLRPRLSLPWRRPGLYLEPAALFDYTLYRLERGDGGPESIERSLPGLSLDGGLVLDRRPAAGGRYLRTLEPRLFYLYRPAEDQAAIPLFDTSRYSFGFAQLFRERRYTGPDRVGDANRLTTALTWRWSDLATDREAFSAGLGRIHYFDDQSVGLEPGADLREAGQSNVVGELGLRTADGWQARVTAEWDPEDNRVPQWRGHLGYRDGHGTVANLGYRARRQSTDGEPLRQSDVSFAYPVGPRWTLLGRHNYSFADDRLIEALAGVEYESCCWALRGVWRRYVTDEADFSDSIFLQLVLKGLGDVGQEAGGVLEHDILGYQSGSH